MNLDEIKARADLKRWPTMAELGQYREDQKALVAEIERLQAAVDAVREIHVRAHAVFSWGTGGVRYETPCQDCDGKSGVHECGCWADSDIDYVCAECHRLGGSKGNYPCPTIRALDEHLGGGE